MSRDNWTISEILDATGGKIIDVGAKPFLDPTFQGISIDSRTIKEGEAFLALKGNKYDGHDFIVEAIEKGAGTVIFQKGLLPSVVRGLWSIVRRKEKDYGRRTTDNGRWTPFIETEDTLKALGDLANFWRKKHQVKVIAITGSNGKTSTKEMTAGILSKVFNTLKTEGNTNNLIGLPLNLLRLRDFHEMAVLELGINQRGEMTKLRDIALPNVRLITNIRVSHLEGFGGLEVLVKEKGELFSQLSPEDTIIVNMDDRKVLNLSRVCSCRQITYGEFPEALVKALNPNLGEKGTEFILSLKEEKIKVKLKVHGRHYISNALAAAAVAISFGVGIETIKEGLEDFRPLKGRMEILNLPNGIKVINDSYNANPSSVDGAIETLEELKNGGKGIAVLGDMLELGEETVKAHEIVGERLCEHEIDYALLMGQYSRIVAHSMIQKGMPKERVFVVESHLQAANILKSIGKKGDWILLKGSRKMEMEKIFEFL